MLLYCDVCKKIVITNFFLRIHQNTSIKCMNEQLKTLGDSKYECEFCFSFFHNNNALNLHTKTCIHNTKKLRKKLREQEKTNTEMQVEIASLSARLDVYKQYALSGKSSLIVTDS